MFMATLQAVHSTRAPSLAFPYLATVSEADIFTKTPGWDVSNVSILLLDTVFSLLFLEIELLAVEPLFLSLFFIVS